MTSPVRVSLPSATIKGASKASATKAAKGGEKEPEEYIFGVKGYWVIAPSRHGAHNWEVCMYVHDVDLYRLYNVSATTPFHRALIGMII
jgi:hypothetical protein